MYEKMQSEIELQCACPKKVSNYFNLVSLKLNMN